MPENPIDKRDRLQGILDQVEPGQLAHREEDNSGRLRRDTTEEHRASLEERIAELDLEIDDSSRDAASRSDEHHRAKHRLAS